MQPLIQREFSGRSAHIAHSTRSDGDLSPSTVAPDELDARRRRAVAHPWCVVRQVHSDRTVFVEDVTAATSTMFADALVTTEPHVVLAVHSGDCVPVGFVSDAAAVGVAHAGWKGLEAGVLESTVRRMRELDPDSEITAAVGPHIRAAQYEFGSTDLDHLARRFGSAVVAQTSEGEPALDLSAAIASELERLGVRCAAWSSDCTAADEDNYWSHRARQEPGRIALVAWISDPSEESNE